MFNSHSNIILHIVNCDIEISSNNLSLNHNNNKYGCIECEMYT